MKIALLHYWLTNMRGGENVLAELCGLFPNADLYTHAYNPGQVSSIFAFHKVHESWIGRLPFAKKKCQAYLPLMPTALRQWDFSGYDLLISSESGPIKGIRKPDGAKHICYCHTPMRYLWDMYPEYFKDAGLCGKAAMMLCKRYLRRYDLKSADCVDQFIANSQFVSERIKRIYARDSIVIHPPVDVDFFSASPKTKDDFYLYAGALVPYKRVDLAIAACKNLKRRLVVVGSGPMVSELARENHDLIQFAGSPSKERLRDLYASARALLFPGIEDFGIVPVEVQAAGTPVIAYGVGGALETVRREETGLFFSEQTADSLADAMTRFEHRDWSEQACRTNADGFRPEVFRSKMMDLCTEYVR